MGIKDLKNVILNNSENGIKEKKLSYYFGKKFAIDLSLFLYKFIYNNNDHIDGLTRQILKLLKNGITPVYILDGEPPEEKTATIITRCNKKKNLEDRQQQITYQLSECSNEFDREELVNEKAKIDKRLVYITDSHLTTSKKLFELFGVPYIQADGEAEVLCSALSYKGLIYGCLTDDSDILPNNGQILLRNFKSSKNYVTEYCLQTILKELDVTYYQFVDLCILLGCDYCPKLYGLGHVKALNMIKKYSTIEGILNIYDKSKVPDNFDYKNARKLFTTLDQNMYPQLRITQINKEKLIDFINNNSEKIHNKYIKEIDTKLEKYYDKINKIN